MTKRIEFFIPCEPPTATAQEKRARSVNGRIQMYDPPKVKAVKRMLDELLTPHKPLLPLTGPLALEVEWGFAAKTHKPCTWRSTRPDTDNLQKILKDCMTRCRFWLDDAQVCCEIVSKYWTAKPGIRILVFSLTDDLLKPETS